MSRSRKQQKPTKPKRIVEIRGSLTFDSALCCDHNWLNFEPSAEVPKPEFDKFCKTCGAGATFGDVAGRRKVVAYDRDWNFGLKKDEPEDVKTVPAVLQNPL